jgi:hypothetical protein
VLTADQVWLVAEVMAVKAKPSISVNLLIVVLMCLE